MRLCMMPVCVFVSRLGITGLVNKIKIYTNLMKLFNYSTFILGLLLSYELEFIHSTKLEHDDAMLMLLKEFGG